MKRRCGRRLALLLLVTAAVLAVAPFAGMELITPARLISDSFARTIFLSFRLPRVLTAFLAGGGLALCGLTFQAMFRNPLADPFTLGIASGASCGAAVTILFGLTGALLGVPAVAFGAFAGAFLSVLLVYGLSSLKKTSSVLTMLLSGIAVSFMFSSVLMFLQYISDLRDSFHIIRWLMGGIEAFGFQRVGTMALFVAVGSVVVFVKLPVLDHLLAGEDIARTRGIDVMMTKKLLLAASTLIVGSIVSLCGPIGFVGMMIPHMCRMAFPLRHRVLGPASFLLGGAFLVVCDTFARMAVAPAEIPVGVITALLGGPFFLWLLFGKRNVVM